MSAKRIKLNTSSCPEQIPHPISYLPPSPARMFCILNYAPQVGCSGTAVTIDTYFFDIGLRNDAFIHIRIVIGAKPIHTKIQKIGDDRNLWRCTGLIPDFEVHKKASTRKFPVRIQAVYQRDIVESVTVGWFTYWEEHCLPAPFQSGRDLPYGPYDGNAQLHATQRPSHSSPPDQVTHGKILAPSLERQGTGPPKQVLRRQGEAQGGYFKGVSLDFTTNPADFGKSLTDRERSLHCRKLIGILCEQKEDTLRISFHPIDHDEYKEEFDEQFVVISCIWRKDISDACYTSVDMIRLVEYIVQAELSSEEKSRIRRNLEFLHPTTVSKAGMEGLFQTIMQFPSPKPRTIEKDIKIFQWDTLVAGLNKVLDKYSWITVQQQQSKRPRSPSHPPSQAQQPSRLRKRRRLESGSPASKVNNNTPQLDYSVTYPFDDPASVDRLQAPNDLRQPQPNFAQSMHVDPLLLHPRDPAMTFPTPGNESPSNLGRGGDAALPHFYPPQAGTNGGSQPLTYGEPFHHFDFLGPQQNLRERHIAHPSMVAQFC